MKFSVIQVFILLFPGTFSVLVYSVLLSLFSLYCVHLPPVLFFLNSILFYVVLFWAALHSIPFRSVPFHFYCVLFYSVRFCCFLSFYSIVLYHLCSIALNSILCSFLFFSFPIYSILFYSIVIHGPDYVVLKEAGLIAAAPPLPDNQHASRLSPSNQPVSLSRPPARPDTLRPGLKVA